MTRLASMTGLPLLVLPCMLLMAGCANAPTAAALASCAELHAQTRHAETELQAAAQQQQEAWKAVLPFAVAARYASGKSATADADRRLAALRAESTQRHCGHD